MKKWVKRAPPSSPTLSLSVTLDREAYKELNLNLPELIRKPSAGHARNRTACTDSGAQITVINENELSALGIKKHTIFPLATNINTVTRSSINLIGGVFLCLSPWDSVTQSVVKTRQMCYGQVRKVINFAGEC